MKKKNQREICSFFIKKGFNNFIGLPDSTFSEFINYGLQKMYEIKNQEKIIEENLKKMGYRVE